MQEVQVFVPTVPDNLPRRASFFGRSIEMAKVLRALGPEERSWGAVIDGIGGIGKTALAIEVAYCCKDQCLFDAFIFVSAKQKRLEPSGLKTETRSATTLDEFINETARALGKPAIARLMGEDKRRALLDALRTTRVLLVYDNLETLTKEEQETLVDWLRFLPQGCKAILTSRRRAGESALWLRLEKLDWETARAIIQHESAREMRLETLWHVDETRWHQLYEETGGSPLALIWTLGLMRTRPLTFDRALEMLRQGSSRESDLQKFIYEEARRELGASDMAVLEALSLFVPSATFGALMFTANLSRTALEAVLERLSALSLVDEVGETEEQYSLHPLTRRFARADLADDTETESVVGQRFSRYWVNYAQRYGGWGKDSYKTFNRLETEWENLYATASWLYEVTRKLSDKAGSPEVAQMLVDLASTLSFFLSFSGRWDEHIQLNEWAYDTVRDSENWRSAGWRAYDLAWMNYKRAHISDATLWLERCSEAWERGGTKGDHATALRLRGLIAQYHNEFGKAEQLLQEALNIRRSLGAHREVAFALTSLGQLAQERKDHDAAQRYFLEALELEHSVNDLAMHAGLCNHLGILALDRGRWDEALDWFQQSLSLAHEVGRVELIANSQHGLARVNEAIGHPDSALPLALEALKIYERLQDKRLAETRKLVERLKKQAGGK
jgi:tetratricopeptide (TPR) repeat protein